MSFSLYAHAHLVLADENRATALQLLDAGPASGRWPAVIAFYSSIHYIQTYLWEFHQIQVSNHHQRQREIDDKPRLEPITENYRRLYDVSLRARYQPVFRISVRQARSLLDVDLAAVERQIKDLLT